MNQVESELKSSPGPVTHVIASQHSKVESQELQGDHTEDALQAVH